MKIAVVGATGLVGTKILEILHERNFPFTEIIPVATEKSVGKEVFCGDKKFTVVDYETALSMKPHVAIFSAGGNTSLELAPKFAEIGTKVIDNSSAWRMDHTKKLIVPEVNGHMLSQDDFIIANPNCSTIQMVMVLKPLHERYKINRVVVSTYQSVSGSGLKAVQQLEGERASQSVEKCYPYQIDLNVIPHIDVFMENDYTKEEMKMIWETKKILDDNAIAVTATTVRVPVFRGHSESVNLEFYHHFEIEDVKQLLSNTEGVELFDNTSELKYPMPILAEEKDAVFVGRIRRDESRVNCLNCWIVSDNLRKGAATNAIQIAEYLLKKNWIV